MRHAQNRVKNPFDFLPSATNIKQKKFAISHSQIKSCIVWMIFVEGSGVRKIAKFHNILPRKRSPAALESSAKFKF